MPLTTTIERFATIIVCRCNPSISRKPTNIFNQIWFALSFMEQFFSRNNSWHRKVVFSFNKQLLIIVIFNVHLKAPHNLLQSQVMQFPKLV
jgi:hypothetical protein